MHCFSAAEPDNTTRVHPCGIENKSKNKDREMTERDSASLLCLGLGAVHAVLFMA